MRMIFRSNRFGSMKLCHLGVSLLLLQIFNLPLNAAVGDSLNVIVSGRFRGRIAGCDCPGGNEGSLARRATVMNDQFSSSNNLVLDCGRFLDLDPVGGKIASRCTLMGLAKLGLRCALVTSADMFYGVKFLREITGSASLDLVCANIIDGKDDTRLFELWKSYSVAGMKVAVAGISRHQTGLRIPGMGSWVTIPPDSVVREMRDAMPQRADLYMLLTDISLDDLRNILPELPEIDFVFTSHRATTIDKPLQIADAVVIKPSHDGRAVDGITVFFNDRKAGYTHFRHSLDDKVTNDSETEKWVNDCITGK